jgi:hypothetical protein
MAAQAIALMTVAGGSSPQIAKKSVECLRDGRVHRDFLSEQDARAFLTLAEHVGTSR